MKAFIKGITGSTMLSVLCIGGGNAERRDSKQDFKEWTSKEAACFQSVFNDEDIWKNVKTLSPKISCTQTQDFIDYLKNNGFSDEQLNKKEAAASIFTVIEKHKELMRSFFGHDHETLFALANRFFEYCFSSTTWPLFAQLLKTPKSYPIARFMYSTMWYNLAGDGWKNWHADTLKNLQEKCRNGDSVTYIAGGTDIYQLLDYGIYSINVIDPMLPSQPNYYSDRWNWLVSGDLGDELTIITTQKKIILKRYSYHEDGKIKTAKSGELPQSLTVWLVYDQSTGKQLGKVTYDRRFCQQSDFCLKPNNHLLISFNELYFLTTVDDDNWGVKPQSLPKDFVMYVKQLHLPVDKNTLCRMRTADASDLCFIRLGTSIN